MIHNNQNRKTRWLALCLAAICVAGIGCDDDDDEPDAPKGRPAEVAQQQEVGRGADAAADAVETPTTGETVTLTDPAEASFTVEMPKGWLNQAYLRRVHDQVRVVATSLSPDNNTLIYFGDPNLPGYFEPSSGIPSFNPMIKIQAFVPADTYFPNYVKRKFGKLPDFKITRIDPNPEIENIIREKLSKPDMQAMGQFNVTATKIAFSYTENGKPMRGVLNGATLGNGSFWFPDVSGISSTGDPDMYLAMLYAMARSHKTTEAWKQKEKEKHERIMAELRQNHAENMARYRAMNQAHEMRMQAIQAAGDASMQRWYAQQAQSDSNHRRFLNYINDEHTVVSSSGKAFQVDNAYERYYVNKHNNTYIGTKSTTDLDALRREAGVNPDDYEEVKIKR